MADSCRREYAEDGSSWTVTNRGEKWSLEEIELAMDDTISDEELAEVLERTIISVKSRRKLLRSCGLYKSDADLRTYHKYTEEEDEFIITHTPSESSKFIGVSIASISYRRRVLADEGKLELSPRRSFSKEEIEVLKDTSLSNAECARRLNRPESSVSYKRSIMKKRGQLWDIPRAHRDTDYTDEEIELLKDPNITNYECSRRLGRTMAAIRTKRNQLGLDQKVLRSPMSSSRGLYYQSEFERDPYPSSDELKSWGIRIDRDWDDLPFGY